MKTRYGTKAPHRWLNAIKARVIGTITGISTQDPVVALTFDDGPHPMFTPRLLEILDRHQARATFFMLGKAANRHPELVRRVAQAGHAIGNHSWDHPSFPLIRGPERRAQIRACAKAIAPYGRRIFRPPYGHQSIGSRLDALRLGYQVVTWNVVAYDWLDHNVGWMAERLISQIRPGSVVLLHEGLYAADQERYADRESMLKATDVVLEQLGERFHFVALPQLFQHGRPQRHNWYLHANQAWLNGLHAMEVL